MTMCNKLLKQNKDKTNYNRNKKGLGEQNENK